MDAFPLRSLKHIHSVAYVKLKPLKSENSILQVDGPRGHLPLYPNVSNILTSLADIKRHGKPSLQDANVSNVMCEQFLFYTQKMSIFSHN